VTRFRRCLLSILSPTCTIRRETIAYLDQGGITLPDRDYYIKDDPKSVETRQKYLEHVQKMFELAGDKRRTWQRLKPRRC
jgi:predicted metalloendopeptidase